MTSKPNVIVCMCDQLRAFELGCYGNKVIRTPNIDRLAVGGVRFEHAVSNNPVCMPARSSLISGQYSRTCGHTRNYVEQDENGQRTMPDYPVQKREQMQDISVAEAFKTQGYDTALFGKWHIHPAPNLMGFDYSLYPLNRHRYTNQTYIESAGQAESEKKIKHFSVDFEADCVEQYLGTHRDKPFFMFYSISPPHMPLADAPDKYLNMYSPEDIPLRPNAYIDGKLTYDDHWFKIYLWDFLYYEQKKSHTTTLLDGFDLRQLIAMYYGLTTWVDDTIGRLMASLAANGLTNNTIVVFTSDHGDLLGSHNTFNKDLLFEESIRIPMIYRGPGITNQSIDTNQVTQLIDVMPTVIDLCGGEIPSSVQGQTLKPILAGQQDSIGDNFAFIESSFRQIGIRTLTHLYGMELAENLRTITNDRYCFYDLRKDPFEQNNLAKTDYQSEIGVNLRRKLTDWHQKTPYINSS